jgi:hypothetical protein
MKQEDSNEKPIDRQGTKYRARVPRSWRTDRNWQRKRIHQRWKNEEALKTENGPMICLREWRAREVQSPGARAPGRRTGSRDRTEKSAGEVDLGRAGRSNQ